KYLELTFDRSQTTLFRCLTNAFQYTGGVPTEIWFDNMKTVVDRSRSQFSKVIFNERFRQYAKEAGFLPIACRAFRPQTKGKVEALARTIERIRVFNYEFESTHELEKIIQTIMDSLNTEEISQAIHECPSDRWSYEKEQLSSFDANQLKIYASVEKQIKRKVSNEAMVQWNQNKYSVPVNYIGKILTLRVKEDKLYIYDDSTLIRTHTMTHQLLNYHRNDYIEILRSDVFKHLEDEELERFVDENLQAYDEL
uniref:Mu transposase domain-containing protein n=2 Tax=Enterococcus TaxID=1350 RepID=UPI0037C0A2A2